MKKLAIGLVMLLVAAFSLALIFGCGGAKEAAYPGSSQPSIFSMFSQPSVWVYNNGIDQFSNAFAPFSGEAVVSAEVLVSNETTGVSTSAAYVGGGIYYAISQLVHGTGESVSTIVNYAGTTMKGGPTVTPNSKVVITSPTSAASVEVPFTVSWTTTDGSSPAAYTWFYIGTYYPTPEAYQVLLPFSQTSFQVTASQITGKGNYVIWVFPINKMSFTGAASNSYGLVGSALYSPSIYVKVN